MSYAYLMQRFRRTGFQAVVPHDDAHRVACPNCSKEFFVQDPAAWAQRAYKQRLCFDCQLDSVPGRTLAGRHRRPIVKRRRHMQEEA